MIKFYNYLSRKVEDFKSVGDVVGLYTCGPTVYNYVHIGNWRTFVFEDVLKRALTFNGYKVRHVMNLTDIDDKIIKKVGEQKTDIASLTNKYADAFMADLSKLNIIPADVYPRARDPKYIDAMIALTKKIIERGVGYVKDGSVYFSIAKFGDYGRLSGTNVKGVKAGARVDVDEYDKENPQDFVLWKKSDEAAKVRGEAFDSPWGVGRPGWHIECSAISMSELGSTIDIHTGGVDLLFPHHENEIAQSEAATGGKFVNYWLEGEHLLVNGEKMAKRLGNVFTIEDIIEKGLPAGPLRREASRQGFDPLALRYLFLTAHYRSKLNFTWESLQSAQNALDNIRQKVSKVSKASKVSKESLGKFTVAINDDLDMPRAVAVFHEALKNNDYQAVIKMDEVLGLGLLEVKKAVLPKGAKDLIGRREKLRNEGNYAESDKIRSQLLEMGVEIEDTTEGSSWKLIYDGVNKSSK